MANAKPRLIPLRKIADVRGAVTVGEGLPFAIKRFFTFQQTPTEITRGGHAHRTLEQLIVLFSGAVVAVTIQPSDSFSVQHRMVDVTHALYVPPMTWLDLHLMRNAQVLVLASAEYDEADYIRNRDEFMALA